MSSSRCGRNPTESGPIGCCRPDRCKQDPAGKGELKLIQPGSAEIFVPGEMDDIQHHENRDDKPNEYVRKNSEVCQLQRTPAGNHGGDGIAQPDTDSNQQRGFDDECGDYSLALDAGGRIAVVHFPCVPLARLYL